jgi:hypothetical protein
MYVGVITDVLEYGDNTRKLEWESRGLPFDDPRKLG